MGKPAAFRAWRKAMRSGVEPAAIRAGLEPWLAYWSARGEPEYVPNPSTWLNQERWNDQPSQPAALAGGVSRSMRNLVEVVGNDRRGLPS